MEFLKIAPIPDDAASDAEIEALLISVYVAGGFTAPELAPSLFNARAVRQRGEVLLARRPDEVSLLGMVIVVPPDSPAKRMAGADEAELQLLAVAPTQRGGGVGRSLVERALELARSAGYRRMLLWTQPSMVTAQRLYERIGFRRLVERDFVNWGRSFLVYEFTL